MNGKTGRDNLKC